MATYKYDGKQWIDYNEFDTALEIVQKSKNNILYLESLHDSGMIEEELQQLRNQLNEVRTELASLEMRTESIEETLPLKQDELSAGLAIGIYGTTIAVKLQDIAAKLDSVPTGAAITTSSADLIRVENKLYYKTETSVGGMTTYAYEELTNSELTERIVAQIPTDFKIDENGRLILVHDGNVIGGGVEIGGIGVTIDAPATATQGTLTATQLGILEASETNYIMFNHEKYYLMDKQHTSGSLTYSHVGADNQINHIKTFTITLSNLTWVLIDTEVGKSEPAITIVEELPEANEEEYNKHKIYLYEQQLKFISEKYNEGNITQDGSLQEGVSLSSLHYNDNKIYYCATDKFHTYDLSTKADTLIGKTQFLCHAFAIIDNYWYAVVGGSVQRYNMNDLSTSSYSPHTDYSLGYTAYSPCIASIGKNIYIFGGEATSNNAASATNNILIFNTETKQTIQTTLPTKLRRATACVVGTYIYIFGGNDGSSNLDTIYKFDTTTNAVETLQTKLPIPIRNLTSSLLGTNIYIFGGSDESGNTLNTIYKFDTTKNTIEELSTKLPEANWGASAITINNNIYIVGGNSSGSSVLKVYKMSFEKQLVFKTIAAE